MAQALKLTGYFAGALFSAQEIYGNRLLAEAIDSASQGIVQIDLPQDMSTQETGDGQVVRAADYLGMIHRDFVFANMNGPELDSGTVAEYVVASMLGMPRVQYRTDFRNVGDVRSEFPPGVTVRKTEAVPYNLMLGHDESATVLANSMELYKSPGGLPAFLKAIAVAAVKGIQLAFSKTATATPDEYGNWRKPLVDYLNLDAAVVAQILDSKQRRHLSDEYRAARDKLLGLQL
jgi:nucleoside 2-deoxyribosyltransferase